MDYISAFDIGVIKLEPRIQEYLRCKKFNKENNIEPEISEEQQFCITVQDLNLIKKHNQGVTNLYSQKRMKNELVKQEKITQNRPSFEQDPRYQRIQNKIASHRQAQQQIRNFEGIDDNYTLFRGSNPYDLESSKQSKYVTKPYEPLERSNNTAYDNQFDMNVNINSKEQMNNLDKYYDNDRNSYCYSTNKRGKSPNTYNHPPSLEYRQVVSFEKPNGLKNNTHIDNVIGKLDRYNSHLSNTYDYVQDSTEDNQTNNREMPSFYQSIPYKFGNGMPDISLEDAMRGGIKDSKRKTTGFRNTFEYNFDYISDEISNSNHTVQMYPQNTRGNDKEIARPNSNASMSEARKRNSVGKNY